MKQEQTLGRAIATLRASKGIRQQDLAKKIGAGASHISLIEAGKREPSLALLRKLAHALETPLDELLGLSQKLASGQRITNGRH